MSITDSAVGAMLEIPPQLFTKIEAAERAIQRLGKTSWSTANSVKTHWSEIATQGLGVFIQKIEEANKALGSLGGKNIDVNMSGFEQAMTQAANTAQTESQKISESISKLAYSDVQFSSITELSGLVKSWKLTYKDLEQALKDFNAQRLNNQVDSEEAQAINNKIQLLREYIRIKTMSESRLQTATIAMRDTTELEYRIGQVNKQLQLEAQRLTDVKVKADEAKQKLSEFMVANQGFSLTDAYSQRTKLESKLATLDIARTQASDNDKPFYEQKFNATKQAIEELQKKIDTFKTLTAQSDVNLQTQQSQQNTAVWTDKLRQLEEELRKVQSANASINAEINKGSTVKSLASEYANLTKRLQEVNNAMANYLAAGGRASAPSYNAMEREYFAIRQRRKEIEQMDIAEINRYRQQMAQQYYQGELSAFVQNEAQKKAVAQQTLNEQIAKAKEAGALYAQSYAGAMSQAEKILGGKSTGKLAVNLENIKRVLADLKTASGRLNLLKPADVKNAEKLKGKISELEALLKKYKDAATPNKPVINPQDAINAAKSATTLKQLEEAYKKLKEAMANINASDPRWAQMNTQLQTTKKSIDDIKKSMGEFRNQTQKSSSSVTQLQSHIASAFSVAAIKGFIKNMVDTRAQFELQRVALGAILQDRDKANEVFLQIQQMALQSPFSIMQLEKATKQVAAFGFEGEKLLPTIKMLADMSAGLGVEIDRLVLVMGHLKARNYLEGTMVRQFTNAGFNVLGELAKYYTEIEDRAVSVAEVQDRVKKKMVEFADVEEVLKRVTSAGGMFYDMQRKQSESIWGQLQRITDAYDLMLNEIGKDNQSVISSMLTLIRQLISHWRMLAPALKVIGSLMATVFATKGIIALVYQLNKLGVIVQGLKLGWGGVSAAAKQAATSMKLAWSSTGLGLLIAGVVTATTVIMGLNEEAKALKEELSHIGENISTELNESLVELKRLGDVISDAATPYTEQKEAIQDLKRAYGEILPSYKLESDYIKGLKGDYSELTAEIVKYYQAKEYQQKYDAVLASQQAKDVTDGVMETLQRMNDAGDLLMKYSESALKTWADKISKELTTGELPNSLDAIEARMKSVFGENINIAPYLSETWGEADFTDTIDRVELVHKALGDMTIAAGETNKALEIFGENSLGALYDEVSRLEKAMSTGLLIRDGFWGALLTPPKTLNEEDIANYAKQAELIKERIREIEEARRKLIEQKFRDKIESETKSFTNQIAAYWELTQKMKSLEKQGQSNTAEFKKLEKAQDAAWKSATLLAEEFGVTFPTSMIDSTETSYDLQQLLDDIAEKAFPKVATKAASALDSIYAHLLGLKGQFKSFFDSLTDGAAGLFARAKESLFGGKKEEEFKPLGEIYSDATKRNVDKYKADMVAINNISKDATKVPADMAKELRGQAKRWMDDVKSFGTTTNKETWLESRRLTKEDIEEFKRNAQAAEAIAMELAGAESKTKGGKGKDPILKQWEDRADALKRYYDAAEKAREHFNEGETSNAQRESFEELWKSLGLNGIKGLSLDTLITQGFTPEKLKGQYVKALKELLKYVPEQYKDLQNKIQEIIASESIGIDFKLKEGEEKQLEKHLNKMFEDLELTKTLKDANVDINLTYMVGGKPTTPEDIRKEIDRLRAEGGDSKDATKRIKILESNEKKLNDILVKEQKERLKNYQKYLGQMYSERAKKMIEAYTLEMDMEADYQSYIKTLQAEAAQVDTTPERKRQIEREITMLRNQLSEGIRGIKNDLEKEINTLDWNAFKSSDIFTQLYSDMSMLSKEGIKGLITQLEDMRKKLQSADDVDYRAVREMTQNINKLRDALIQVQPYTEFKNARAAAKELSEKYGSLAKAHSALESMNKQQLSLEVEISNLETIIGLKDKGANLDAENNGLSEEQTALYQKYKLILTSVLAAKRKELKTSKDNSETLSNQIDLASKQKEAYNKQADKIGKIKEVVVKTTDALFDMADAVGLELDEEWKNLISSIIESTFQAVLLGLQMQILGIQMNSALGIVGWIATGLQVVANLLMAVFAAHDKSLQRQIEDLEENVESLQRSYQALEKSIDAAFTSANLKSDSRQAINNLKAQQAALQQMIALEEAKKKTDDDKIKDWSNQIADINDQIKELQETITEKWGGFGSIANMASASEAFAEAWLDAYKETGDGLDALNEQWDEYIDNLIIKQMFLRVVPAKMKKLFDMVDKAVSIGSPGDEHLTKMELDAILAEKDRINRELNEELKDFLDELGYISGKGEYVLSDLQKGIQNITEPQAAAIEAYLNSMRFAVFKHTEQLDTLIATIQAQYGGGENPILAEIKGIRIVLDSIDRRLGSVIDSGGGRGSYLRIK